MGTTTPQIPVTSKVDLHSHTRGSDGRGTPEQIAQAAKKAGLDVLCLTDHHTNTNKETLATADALLSVGVQPVVGCEYSTAQGHLLVYGLVVPPYHWGRYPEMQTVIDDVNERGGVCIIPHPYKGYQRCLKDKVTMMRGALVEALNGQVHAEHRSLNDAAYRASQRMKVACVGSSDSHSPDTLGLAFTLFEGWVRSTGDLLVALKSGTGFRPKLNGEKLRERQAILEAERLEWRREESRRWREEREERQGELFLPSKGGRKWSSAEVESYLSGPSTSSIPGKYFSYGGVRMQEHPYSSSGAWGTPAFGTLGKSKPFVYNRNDDDDDEKPRRKR